MKFKLLVLAIMATLGFGLAFAAPSQAQATRTWVSGVGDDANPCSRTAPCKTFAGAISKTAAAGEINCIDPGGFGAVTITKSITITCVGVEAGVLVSGTNGIIVNVGASDNVVLQGLDIEGLNTGLSGVKIVGAGTTVIRNCTIHQFTTAAVSVVGTAGAKATIINSYLSNNAGGVDVAGAGGAANAATIYDSILETNGSFSVRVVAAQAVAIGNSKLIGSGTKLVISGGGTIDSYGNNIIRGATAAPTTTLPLM